MEAVFGESNLIFVRAEKDCLSTNEKQCDGDAGQRKGVRQRHRLPVHHHQTYEQEAEDGDAEYRYQSMRI